MSESFRFDLVDDFTTGTIGEPGQRVFFLQLLAGLDRVTLRCEKGHVSALSASFRTVLEDLPPVEGRTAISGELLVAGEEWIVGGIGLAYDEDGDRIIVQLEELVLEDDDDPTAPEPATVRFGLTRAMASAFCDRADDLLSAGRPPCQWCGRPIDPTGHACPRMN
ncbi:MAG: DUF3090 family protein [Actinomycetota bacterium]